MKVINMKGLSKKEVINATSGENSVKDFVELDSLTITGAAIYETTHPTTGEVTGAFILKTDIGVVTGISNQVYNAVEGMLDLYSTRELTAGVQARLRRNETDGDRAYITIELL